MNSDSRVIIGQDENNNTTTDHRNNNGPRKRKISKSLKISAKKVVDQDDDGGGGHETDHVKLSFIRSQLIGSGCFGLVFKAKVREVTAPRSTVSFRRSNSVEEDEEEKRSPIGPQRRTLALKVISVRRRECRELSLLKGLKHKNVVRLHYYFFSVHQDEEGEKELCCNMFFEYLPTTVLDYIQERSFVQEREALHLYGQLLAGLDYLHQQGICHRDVKPSNLLLKGASLKICDFGSAKRLSGREPEATYICSRFYRAPELLLGSEWYTTRVDIWSASCVLAEMLGGQTLFKGESTMGQLVEIICILGPLSAEDLRKIGSILSSIDDKVLSSRLCGTLRDRLAAKIGSERVSDITLDILVHSLRYIPEERPSAAELLTCVTTAKEHL